MNFFRNPCARVFPKKSQFLTLEVCSGVDHKHFALDQSDFRRTAAQITGSSTHMPAGRPRESDEHHALRGTKPKPSRAKTDGSPTISSGRPRCPAHVKKSAEAFAAWKDAVRILKRRRQLSAGDAPTLAVYAVVTAKWIKANEDIEARGFEVEVTKTNKAGETYETTIPNASVRIATDCERQLLQLAKALGMTPDTREKVRPTKDAPNVEKFRALPGTAAYLMPEYFDKNGRPIHADN